MAFIFQAKPNIYPIPERLDIGKAVGWLASRYKDYMHTGNIVYFWRAGDKERRGIYGWGDITSNTTFIDKKGAYRIAVTCRVIFPRHINVSSLYDDPILKDLQILRSAMGTNFLLSKEENDALIVFINGEFGDSLVPPAEN
jgi:hypothetical protein